MILSEILDLAHLAPPTPSPLSLPPFTSRSICRRWRRRWLQKVTAVMVVVVLDLGCCCRWRWQKCWKWTRPRWHGWDVDVSAIIHGGDARPNLGGPSGHENTVDQFRETLINLHICQNRNFHYHRMPNVRIIVDCKKEERSFLHNYIGRWT
jgi:hypothetical protein